jgi:hypothetical protein
MELVKDIYFNTDKLVENTKVKVSYTGKFYQGNNEKVFLHYGYGKDWNNINEIEMSKTDLGYQAELDLIGKDTINFCFKNQNDEWDNNFGQNYIFDIEKKANVQEKLDHAGNVIFWGKTFSKKDENNSGILDDTATLAPNSFDTVIPNNCNAFETQNPVQKKLGVTLEKPAENDCFAVIKTSFGNTDAEGVAKPGIVNFDIGETKKVQTINTINQNNTSIALAPTGFSAWTKKIKANVCKFFDYLPKLLSGNYKRNVDNSIEKK